MFPIDNYYQWIMRYKKETLVRKILTSNTIEYIFLKISGSIIKSHLQKITSVIKRIDGNKKILIIHGGGKQLSQELKKQNIPYHFRDGIRETSEECLNIAMEVFEKISLKIAHALIKENIDAYRVDKNFFLCHQSNHSANLSGEIIETNTKSIEKIVLEKSIPIISPIGYTHGKKILNLDADQSIVALSNEIKPKRIIFLSNILGIVDDKNNIIREINIDDDYYQLINSRFITGGMKYKLKQIKRLSEILTPDSEIYITHPNYLDEVLFSKKFTGTKINIK